MITTKKELKEFLNVERKKYFSSRKKEIFSRLFLGNSSEKVIIWKYQKILRKCEYHINRKHKIRSKIYLHKLHRIGNKYGLHIAPNVFDRGLKIMHLGPIYVNDGAIVGKNCSIHVNTSIVAGGTNDLAPKIGDDVIIGIGAILLGDIKIGNNCAIGAGAVVNKSFEEDNVTIAGVPAKIISHNSAESWRKRK